MPRQLHIFVFSLILVAATSAQAHAAAKVVASIAPIHSIAARVMAGAGKPTLLVPPSASPHAFALRPSSARALNQADVVFWVGESLEAFLERPIAALAPNARIVELLDADGVALLPTRAGDAWDGHGPEPHAPKHHQDGDGEAHDHGMIDPHIWLDPANAAAIASAMADVLAQVDPATAGLYRANASAFGEEMARLTATITAAVAATPAASIVVFHDAYQYFERRFGLDVIGSVTVNPETPPSARRLQDIRRRIAATGAQCVFVEPQFNDKITRVVTEGGPARIAILDPIGATLQPGPDLYPRLIAGLAAAVRARAED